MAAPDAVLSGKDNEASEGLMNGFVLVFLVVLAFMMITNHLISHKYHLKYMTEAGAIIIVGALLGGIVMLATHGNAQEWLSASISPTVFFIGFLPPIIFNSGYTIKRKVFLFYFVPSVLYAVVGTIITTLFIGLSLYGLGQAGASHPMSLPECLAFGSLITSTDTVAILSIFERLQVEPLMFYLCFGESVLNDAVVLVLYNIFTKFIGETMTWSSVGYATLDFLVCFVGSMAVGFAFGCLSALLFKHLDLRHSIYEMAVYLLLAYIPSLFSDVIHLSGIVTILFTGMFSRHYTHPNLSVNGQAKALFLFALLSILSETAVFLQLGLSVFSTRIANLHPAFIFWTLLLILVGRALNIYPLSWVINRCTAIKVPGNIQHMLWYAGLRGAMAYVCAKGFPDVNGNQAVIEATTMMIVLATVFSFGTFTISTLQFLRIPIGVPANEAVSLSVNQSRLLAWEGRYLLPFLHRKLGFEGSGGLARKAAHKDMEAGAIAEVEEDGEGEKGATPGSPMAASGQAPALGRRGSMGGGTVFGSFMRNDLIDTLFRRDSLAAAGPTGGALSPTRHDGAGGGGGGGGMSRLDEHVMQHRVLSPSAQYNMSSPSSSSSPQQQQHQHSQDDGSNSGGAGSARVV